jgi:hypothetical protein
MELTDLRVWRDAWTSVSRPSGSTPLWISARPIRTSCGDMPVSFSSAWSKSCAASPVSGSRRSSRPQEHHGLPLIWPSGHRQARAARGFRRLRGARGRTNASAASRDGQLGRVRPNNGFRPADRQYAGSRSVQVPVASADTGKLIKAAVTALAVLYMPGYRYKEAGVILLDLLPAAAAQAGLFDLPDDVRSIASMRAIDNLNARTAAARSRWASPASAKSGGCGGIHIAALHDRLGCATADLTVPSKKAAKPANFFGWHESTVSAKLVNMGVS